MVSVNDTMEDRRITLRVPPILAARVDSAVAKLREEGPRISLNDFIVEAIRDKLDGDASSGERGHGHQGDPSSVGAAPGASIHETPTPPTGGIPDGVQPGRAGDGFWDEWIRNSKRLDPEARQASFLEALAERQPQLPAKWGKMLPDVRMAWLRANDQ